MSWRMYVILAGFGLFVLLMIFNPRFSCFGKRLQSPFYPLLRKKKARSTAKKEIHKFRPPDGDDRPGVAVKTPQAQKTEDYGFRLD